MTERRTDPILASVDDLLALRDRIQEVFARRNAERQGSPAWLAANAELETMQRRVWKRPDRDQDNPPAALS